MKNFLIIVLSLISIGLVAYVVIDKANLSSSVSENQQPQNNDTKEINFEKEKEQSDSSSNNINESPIETQIMGAIIEKRGNFGDLVITVDEIIDDTYAKGGAMPAEGIAGGGMWIAKKVDGKWELVWDGNGAIYCSDLIGYEDIPGRLVPECYDETTMTVVIR